MLDLDDVFQYLKELNYANAALPTQERPVTSFDHSLDSAEAGKVLDHIDLKVVTQARKTLGLEPPGVKDLYRCIRALQLYYNATYQTVGIDPDMGLHVVQLRNNLISREALEIVKYHQSDNHLLVPWATYVLGIYKNAHDSGDSEILVGEPGWPGLHEAVSIVNRNWENQSIWSLPVFLLEELASVTTDPDVLDLFASCAFGNLLRLRTACNKFTTVETLNRLRDLDTIPAVKYVLNARLNGIYGANALPVLDIEECGEYKSKQILSEYNKFVGRWVIEGDGRIVGFCQGVNSDTQTVDVFLQGNERQSEPTNFPNDHNPVNRLGSLEARVEKLETGASQGKVDTQDLLRPLQEATDCILDYSDALDKGGLSKSVQTSVLKVLEDAAKELSNLVSDKRTLGLRVLKETGVVADAPLGKHLLGNTGIGISDSDIQGMELENTNQLTGFPTILYLPFFFVPHLISQNEFDGLTTDALKLAQWLLDHEKVDEALAILYEVKKIPLGSDRHIKRGAQVATATKLLSSYTDEEITRARVRTLQYWSGSSPRLLSAWEKAPSEILRELSFSPDPRVLKSVHPHYPRLLAGGGLYGLFSNISLMRSSILLLLKGNKNVSNNNILEELRERHCNYVSALLFEVTHLLRSGSPPPEGLLSFCEGVVYIPEAVSAALQTCDLSNLHPGDLLGLDWFIENNQDEEDDWSRSVPPLHSRWGLVFAESIDRNTTAPQWLREKAEVLRKVSLSKSESEGSSLEESSVASEATASSWGKDSSPVALIDTLYGSSLNPHFYSSVEEYQKDLVLELDRIDKEVRELGLTRLQGIPAIYWDAVVETEDVTVIKEIRLALGLLESFPAVQYQIRNSLDKSSEIGAAVQPSPRAGRVVNFYSFFLPDSYKKRMIERMGFPEKMCCPEHLVRSKAFHRILFHSDPVISALFLEAAQRVCSLNGWGKITGPSPLWHWAEYPRENFIDASSLLPSFVLGIQKIWDDWKSSAYAEASILACSASFFDPVFTTEWAIREGFTEMFAENCTDYEVVMEVVSWITSELKPKNKYEPKLGRDQAKRLLDCLSDSARLNPESSQLIDYATVRLFGQEALDERVKLYELSMDSFFADLSGEVVSVPLSLSSPLREQGREALGAIGYGLKLAAANEAGEIFVDVAAELAADSPFVSEFFRGEKGREVAKLLMAFLVQTGAEQTDLIPHSEFVSEACKLQMTASSFNLVAPQLHALRKHLTKLAQVGANSRGETLTTGVRVIEDMREEFSEIKAELEELQELKSSSSE